jgi:hypothetical protein
MRQAGAGNAFAYSSAHTTYVGAAKRNRLANNSNPFKTYRITEIAPRVGDIVCKERQDANGNWSGVNYDNVDDGQFRSSHCDIVTAVRSGQLTTVGGNLSDSVSTTPVSTDAQGRVTTSRYYAVIRIEGSSATQGAFGYEAEDEGEFGRRRQMLGRPMRYRRSQNMRRRPVRRLPRPGRRPILRRPAWGRHDAPPEPADDQLGSQGSEHIRWVQSSLNQALGLQLPVDGIMGRETRSAVRSFQEKQGLPVDGTVGPDTERALIEARRGTSSSGTGNAGADQSPSSPQEPGVDEETLFELEASADPCSKIDCGLRPPYPPPEKGKFSFADRFGRRWYTPFNGDNLSALSKRVLKEYMRKKGVSRNPTNSEVQAVMDSIRACSCNAHLRGKMFLPRFQKDRFTPGGPYYGSIYIPLKFD